jgi:iron complex outermembrane recepter protein
MRCNQSLSNVPAAFVISADDIPRSGALARPDVLRLVPGILVGQIDHGCYAASARWKF